MDRELAINVSSPAQTNESCYSFNYSDDANLLTGKWNMIPYICIHTHALYIYIYIYKFIYIVTCRYLITVHTINTRMTSILRNLY